jgi:hypothetical protein
VLGRVIGDNQICRRVASKRNVTEVVDVVWWRSGWRLGFLFGFGTLGLTSAKDKATQGCDLSAD